jgi:hypothetical protein
LSLITNTKHRTFSCHHSSSPLPPSAAATSSLLSRRHHALARRAAAERNRAEALAEPASSGRRHQTIEAPRRVRAHSIRAAEPQRRGPLPRCHSIELRAILVRPPHAQRGRDVDLTIESAPGDLDAVRAPPHRRAPPTATSPCTRCSPSKPSLATLTSRPDHVAHPPPSRRRALASSPNWPCSSDVAHRGILSGSGPASTAPP